MSEINRFDFDARDRKNTCQCCLQTVVREWDECPVCGWFNDVTQSTYPNMEGGENRMSLNQARKAWAEGRKII